ncbi:MAG: hypothetical protein JNL03_08230 [Prolixibacteraceae bacterium]|nr:hypothetical protein [Prolixibacteraceae bacterium]
MSINSAKSEESNINLFYEWAIWGHLESEKNLELILLKGHLLLEVVLDSLLFDDKKDYKNYSFHRKVTYLENLDVKEESRQRFIVMALRDLNKMRNKLAHEFKYDIANGEFDEWSSRIHDNLEGMKWTRYTRRTKIIHSFSILAKNILDIKTTKASCR